MRVNAASQLNSDCPGIAKNQGVGQPKKQGILATPHKAKRPEWACQVRIGYRRLGIGLTSAKSSVEQEIFMRRNTLCIPPLDINSYDAEARGQCQGLVGAVPPTGSGRARTR